MKQYLILAALLFSSLSQAQEDQPLNVDQIFQTAAVKFVGNLVFKYEGYVNSEDLRGMMEKEGMHVGLDHVRDGDTLFSETKVCRIQFERKQFLIYKSLPAYLLCLDRPADHQQMENVSGQEVFELAAAEFSGNKNEVKMGGERLRYLLFSSGINPNQQMVWENDKFYTDYIVCRVQFQKWQTLFSRGLAPELLCLNR